MPQPFSPQKKAHALQRLDANFGNIARTAAETGISERTLLRWRQHLIPPTPPPPTQPITPPAIPSDDLQALINLKVRLLQAADFISLNIIPAVEIAPLNQRVAALAQLIDRIIKLAAELPEADDQSWKEDFAGEEPDEEEQEEMEASAFTNAS